MVDGEGHAGRRSSLGSDGLGMATNALLPGWPLALRKFFQKMQRVQNTSILVNPYSASHVNMFDFGLLRPKVKDQVTRGHRTRWPGANKNGRGQSALYWEILKRPIYESSKLSLSGV